jgi:hypothetical protein
VLRFPWGATTSTSGNDLHAIAATCLNEKRACRGLQCRRNRRGQVTGVRIKAGCRQLIIDNDERSLIEAGARKADTRQ